MTDEEIVDLIRKRVASIRNIYGLDRGPILANPKIITAVELWDLLLCLDPDEIIGKDSVPRSARPGWRWLIPEEPPPSRGRRIVLQ